MSPPFAEIRPDRPPSTRDPYAAPSGRRSTRSRLPMGAWATVILAGLTLFYVALSGGPALFEQLEGQYAGAAREMLQPPGEFAPGTAGRLWRGHALVPTNDGVPRLQKPPLVYWLLMGSLRVFGVNEFAARLPNALAAGAWFTGVFFLGRRLGGAALGMTAAAMLGTMAGAFVFGHLIMPEVFLAATLTGTFVCFAGALAGPPGRAGRWMLGAWACMALGCLCKGLHGAAYPLAVAALAAWRWPGSRGTWRALGRPAGWGLFLVLLLPWYGAMEWRFPGFLRDQFLNEQLGHVFNRRWPPDSRRVFFPAFWAQHLVYFLPWTLFVPAAFLAWRQRRRAATTTVGGRQSRDGREMALHALPGLWVGVTAVSVVFSSLQDYYTMTAWGAVALWLARPWVPSTATAAATGRTPALPRGVLTAPGWTLAVLGGMALGVGLIVQTQFGVAGTGPRASIGERDSILNTVRDFPVEHWRTLRPALWAAGAALLVGGVASARFARHGRRPAAVAAVAVAMLPVLVGAGRGLGAVEDELSLKKVARAINARTTGDGGAALVVCQGYPADNPSLFFYLDREVRWLDARYQQEFAPRALGIGRELFLGREDFIWRWFDPAGPPVFLVCEEAELPRWRETLQLTPVQAEPIARSGTRVALLNRPTGSSAGR